MKNYFLLVIFLLFSLELFAQSKLEGGIYYGVSGSKLARKELYDGSGAVSLTQIKEVGLSISNELKSNLSLKGGLNYSFGKMNYTPPPCPNCFLTDRAFISEFDFRMISVPVLAEYSFWKYLYVSGGPFVDFQKGSNSHFSSQSGIGYLLGFGAKYRTNRMMFSIFPNYKRHSVIPFEKSSSDKFLLQELGLQFGLGYSF